MKYNFHLCAKSKYNENMISFFNQTVDTGRTKKSRAFLTETFYVKMI